MNLHKFRKYLREYPAVSPGKLFKEAGLSDRLWQYINKGQKPFTEETGEKLLPTMRKYGYRLEKSS